MASLAATILEHGLIAVIDSPIEDAVLDWAMAVSNGGIKLLGIPVTLGNVMDTVSDLSDDAGLVVGISGVMRTDQVAVAVAAGAELVMTPLADRELIRTAKSRDLVVIAGAATPTEVAACLEAGADFVSLHPIGALSSGKTYFQTIARMFPGVHLLVSGHIDVENAPDYLEAGAAAAIVDRGVFPDTSEPSALEIITTRAVALVEVCADVLGMPQRASMHDALKHVAAAAAAPDTIQELLVQEPDPGLDPDSFDLEIGE